MVTTQYRFQRKDGSWCTLEASRTCITDDGTKEIVSNVRDITERTEMENALRISQERFRDFAVTAADFFWEMDANLRFTYISERFQEKTRWTADSALGRSQAEVFASHLDDTEMWKRHLLDLEARRPYYDFETKQLYVDGSVRVFRDSSKPIYDDQGDFVGYRGATRDVTDAHVLAEKLSYQASHDMLTGLINRQHFDERLQRVIDTAQVENTEHMLCYLDLDQFKVINDTCGHVAGDVLASSAGECASVADKKPR